MFKINEQPPFYPFLFMHHDFTSINMYSLTLYLDHVYKFKFHVLLVMGSIQWPLVRLDVYGSLRANGQSFGRGATNRNGSLLGGLGGGSGGTVLLFLQELQLSENSSLSVVGGNGGTLGGGGGGGGRVHFHWSKIDVGDEYTPVASINGSISSRYAYYYYNDFHFRK
jgi:hypothetical protein